MSARVGIVDYGVGNLFSIQQACHHVGLDNRLITLPEEFSEVNAVILPGVGAFGPAMDRLKSMGLDKSIRDWADKGNLLLGICLGFQLFMSESCENGYHEGLGLIDGSVQSFRALYPSRTIRVPNIGWRAIAYAQEPANSLAHGPLIQSVNTEKEYYFVHSYFVDVTDDNCLKCSSLFEESEFCCAAAKGNILGLQFHPERSARQGLKVFDSLKKLIETDRENLDSM